MQGEIMTIEDVAKYLKWCLVQWTYTGAVSANCWKNETRERRKREKTKSI